MTRNLLIGFLHLLLLSSGKLDARSTEEIQGVDLPSDEWLNCEEFKPTTTLSNCLCSLSPNGNIKVNCDNAVFSTDFPTLPYRQPITHFSMRFVNAQNIPPQVFLGSKIPLRYLDLSHNLLRRLNDKATEGLMETLEVLDVSFNLLGDGLNPIFSTNEFKKLPRLRILKLGNNLLQNIDDGILHGCLSMQELFLDNNNFKTVPKESFKGPNSLKILDMSFNLIDELKSDQFTTQPSLLLVNLKNNKLFSIQGNAFRGLSNLKILDISWNRIHRLNSDAFAGLSTLEHINLSNNFLTQIPISALNILKGTLKTLSLNSNLIRNLDNVQLNNLNKLQILDLSRNRISEIPKGFFEGMTRLRELNLGVNQLRTLSAVSFEGLTTNLQVLNLMDNNLLAFPYSALEPLQAITSLNLDFNRISALTSMKSSNMTRLSISNNLIREIPTETFTYYPSLKFLNLKGNLIENMDEVELPSGIVTLNLDMNHLKTIPRFQLTALEGLSVKGNELTSLLQHNFVLLSSLKTLDLSENQLKSSMIFPNTFDGLSSLLTLSMSQNNLDQIPNLKSLPTIQMLNFSGNNIKIINNLENHEFLTVLDLSNNEIKNLKPDMFSNVTFLSEISLKNNKLSSFKGFSQDFDMLRSLDLSNNEITYVYPNSFERLPELWNLNMNGNKLSIFPTEFLKNCKELRYLGLSSNNLKSLNEMNFVNFQHLRILLLNRNLISYINQNTFLNSTQIQVLDFSENKLEAIDGSIFHGLLRLELDLSDNYLTTLPQNMFDRANVQKLQKIDISRNSFQSLPHESLQKQYFHLESLNAGANKIQQIPSNLNMLVNVKNLDISENPLDEASIRNILNEPKTVRFLNLANCSVSSLPILETPFLRELNLSSNQIQSIDDTVFRRTTLLEILSLENNEIKALDKVKFPPSLIYLDVSTNPIKNISGNYFPQSLEALKLNNLVELTRVDKASLNLRNLIKLEIFNSPKLGYLDVRGLLSHLQYLESFDFEFKDNEIVDQLHPGLNARVSKIGIRGRRVRSISTGTFAGLTSPRVQINLLKTSINLLPSILVPVPMSSDIILDVTDSKINNLSPPFLSNNIKIEGVSPVCDCNAVNLVRYLQRVNSNSHCSGPAKLAGLSVMSIGLEDLVCESTISTTETPLPISVRTTTATTEINDIIWSLPTKASNRANAKSNSKPTKKVKMAPKLKSPDINKMDNLIIGIVGGVVGLIILFIFIIVCFVKMSGGSGGGGGLDNYPGGAASVISVPAYAGSSKCACTHSVKGGGGPVYLPSSYSTVRSTGKGISPNYHGGGGGGGGGSVYAMHTGGGGGYSLGQGYNFNNSIGPSVYARHHQMYGSLPYIAQEDYDRR